MQAVLLPRDRVKLLCHRISLPVNVQPRNGSTKQPPLLLKVAFDISDLTLKTQNPLPRL